MSITTINGNQAQSAEQRTAVGSAYQSQKADQPKSFAAFLLAPQDNSLDSWLKLQYTVA